jgi:hypothetical protein
MTQKNKHDEIFERIADELADSVLSVPDEAILSGSGAHAEEAEHTRTVLRDASQRLENVKRYLSSLGHTINPNSWHRERFGYRNTCLACGSFVTFKTTTGEMRGNALDGWCPERDQYTIRRREVSRR